MGGCVIGTDDDSKSPRLKAPEDPPEGPDRTEENTSQGYMLTEAGKQERSDSIVYLTRAQAKEGRRRHERESIAPRMEGFKAGREDSRVSSPTP